MVKKLLYILTIILTSACSAEDDPVVSPTVEQDKNIYMSVGVSPMNKVVNVTRSGFISKDEIRENRDTIGFFALRSTEAYGHRIDSVSWANSEQYRYYRNSPYIYNSKYKCLTTPGYNARPMKFPVGEDAALAFFAYMPYSMNVETDSETHAPLIPIEITGDNTQIDYLYSTSTLCASELKKSNEDIMMTFSHALSRLKLVVSKGENNFTENYCPKLTNITVITNNRQCGYMRFTKNSVDFIYKDNKEGTNTFSHDFEQKINVDKSEINTDVDLLFIPGDDVISKILISGVYENGNEFKSLSIYDKEMNDPIKNKPIMMEPGNIYKLKLTFATRSNFQQDGQNIGNWEIDKDNDKIITVE